ncbi:hypothetical protein DIPPA_00791 [Diplonema papillatum]|nr:hypothetical protein DIPPA_00791 [Diplonema papillatum]
MAEECPHCGGSFDPKGLATHKKACGQMAARAGGRAPRCSRRWHCRAVCKGRGEGQTGRKASRRRR